MGKVMIQKIREMKKPPVVCILCLVGILLELFVFNFRHWESLLWSDEYIFMQEWLVGAGLKQEGPAVYRVVQREGEKTATIELLNVCRKLHNIHVSLEILEPESLENEVVDIQLEVTDAAHEKYFRLPKRGVLTSVPKSEYVRLHTVGKTQEVFLRIHAHEGDLIRINDISGNVHVPMFFSWGRLLFIIVLLVAGYYLRPSSELHKKSYLNSTWKGKVLIGVVLCLECIAVAKVCTSDPQAKKNSENMVSQQYQRLAHSLAEGRTWLDTEPDEILKSLSNPYDYRLRSMVMETEGGSYLWDTAYYEGRYYVYFGIVPELLFFLPYYLVTGQDLSTITVILILGCLCIGGIFVLMDRIIRRWYPKTSFSAYFLLTLLVANGCGIWSLMRNPFFYGIPILSALVVGVWGLSFWLDSLGEKGINRVKMGIGSLLVAMIAGCRPQLLVLLFMAVPIYWQAVREKRLLGDKKALDLAAFGVPILIVALGIMYYNAIRFGSVFEFGAQYNLTIHDMTHNKMEIGRTAFGFFTMLFQPPYMTGLFPYYHHVMLENQYYGQALMESGFGGVVATNLILLVSLIPFRFKGIMEHKSAYCTACLFTGFGILTAFFDIQAGGLIPRYTVDFTWLLFLSAAMILLAAGQKLQRKAYWRTGYTLFLILFAQCMLFNFLTIFTDVYDQVKEVNPHWFYQAEHLIEFWL